MMNKEVIENNYTFLIADNDVVNIMYIEVLLLKKLKFDCRIIHVVNGLEAVKICKKNTHIDLVLMDLKMPIMSGFEATKLIKKFSPNLPIIAQSAYSSEEDKEKAKDAGCIDFITKPIKKEILNDIIKKHLAGNLIRS